MPPAEDVLVVGGGLAGLSTACALADAGARVTLVEMRPFAGGRVYSFRDPKSGIELDNGQHVLLGCCTELLGFLSRVGARRHVAIQDRFEIRFLEKGTGRSSILRESRLPRPLHLLPGLLGFKPLSLADRFRLLRASRALGAARLPDIECVTFEDWLRGEGQSPEAIRKFWNTIVLSALNERVDRVSAADAAFVFQEGFLGSREGLRVGYATRGQSIWMTKAIEYLESKNGRVLFGRRVAQFAVEGRRVMKVLLGEGGSLSADRFVSALPHPALVQAIPLADPFFADLANFGTSPIVNVHLVYDRPITNVPFAAVLDSPAQWVFNKAMLWKEVDVPGSVLSISLSGAGEFLLMPRERLESIMSGEAAEIFPAAREARLISAHVVRERHATFSMAPGARKFRRPQRTPLENLFLAGDWTQTGWPSTMEGAVRSGRLAAEAMLKPDREGGEKGPEAFDA